MNSCYNNQVCQYNMNNAYFDLNNLMNKKSCKQNITLPCNESFDNDVDFTWAFIIFISSVSISLSICTIYNCRRLWIYNYIKRIESREQTLNTPFINNI